MIKSLRIKNLATIEDIELNFKQGFSILTGETGAGKSIIIDGIKLLLGEKGSADIIRTGKKEASIEAIFFLPQGALGDKTLFPENEIFIQRLISSEGTAKGYINGVLVPIKKLKQLSLYLIDIYGQNDHDFLLRVENHLNYLDYYADALLAREEVSRSAHELKKLFKEKKELEAREQEREQRLDFLDFQIKEIEKANLQPEEEEALRYERNILKNAEKISTLVEKAIALSHDQENSLSTQLVKLQNITGELSDFDRVFKDTNEAVNQFSIVIKEFSAFLIKFKEEQIISPEKLEKIEERLSQIEKLKRKYGNSIPEILSYLVGMKKARFKIKIEDILLSPEELDKVNEKGTEEVEFLISPNPGEELRPLRKIASGGELSRIMLALKSIGKESGKLKTLIFDEIDSGIGGKTAEFVAKKLNQLSGEHQIICITHLPQIASFAPYHYRIDKKIDKERTYTTVKKLIHKERITEIARLLSGTRITETSLQNAREMLDHNLNISKQ